MISTKNYLKEKSDLEVNLKRWKECKGKNSRLDAYHDLTSDINRVVRHYIQMIRKAYPALTGQQIHFYVFQLDPMPLSTSDRMGLPTNYQDNHLSFYMERPGFYSGVPFWIKCYPCSDFDLNKCLARVEKFLTTVHRHELTAKKKPYTHPPIEGNEV